MTTLRPRASYVPCEAHCTQDAAVTVSQVFATGSSRHQCALLLVPVSALVAFNDRTVISLHLETRGSAKSAGPFLGVPAGGKTWGLYTGCHQQAALDIQIQY